jgi:hypothetical protein
MVRSKGRCVKKKSHRARGNTDRRATR